MDVKSWRYTLLYILLLCCFPTVQAQQDPVFSHYFDLEPGYNPAAVGKESKLNIAGAYSLKLLGFEHAPRTMYLGADVPFFALGGFHGAGVKLVNDDVGLFSHRQLAVQYALKRQLWGGSLGVGVQGGLLSEAFDGSKVDVEDASDPALAKVEATGNALDVAVGVYYARKNVYAGLSVQHLNAPVVELGETSELHVPAHYYFTAGYNIPLRNPFLSIKTSALAHTDAATWGADVTARLCYAHDNKYLYGGVSYAVGTSVSVLVGGVFKGIRVGYAFEVYTTGWRLDNGGHELFVSYQTALNFSKKGKKLHKSVRVL